MGGGGGGGGGCECGDDGECFRCLGGLGLGDRFFRFLDFFGEPGGQKRLQPSNVFLMHTVISHKLLPFSVNRQDKLKTWILVSVIQGNNDQFHFS